MLSEVDQRRYVMTLCLRCCNGDATLHDDVVTFQLRISKKEWIKTKAALIEVNLIDDLNRPVGWDKRQYVSDTSTERSRKYRKKKKQQCNVAVTPPETEAETETDTEIKTIEKETLSISKNGQVPYKKIVDLYHKCLPELPAVVKLTPKRKAQIRQRFKEDLGALRNWEHYFNHVRGSDFLMGRVQPANGRGPFLADLEWLTSAGNFTKVSEDKYHV